MSRSLAVFGVAAIAGLGTSVGAAATLGVSPRAVALFSAAAPVPLSTCTLTAVADSYADGAALSAGSNFGTAATLSVRSSLLGNQRSFVRFDLTACPSFSAARVTNATMYLFATSAAAGRTYDLHRVAAAWTETVITSNNQPAVAASATASAVTAAGEMSWTVTADVAAFVDGSATNFGWRIHDRTEDAVVAVTSAFASREHSTPANRPRLQIGYYP